MAQMINQYDSYNRSWPDVFVGEYAGTEWGPRLGHQQVLRNALAEALFMIGFEKNADKVKQSSFGALLRHAQGTEWDYSLVVYDSYRLYGMPSYFVQQLFSMHRGEHTLQVTLSGSVLTNATASVQLDGSIVLKAVSYGGPGGVALLQGPVGTSGPANVTILTAQPDDQNSLSEPRRVAPVFSTVAAGADGTYAVSIPEWCLVVVVLPALSRNTHNHVVN